MQENLKDINKGEKTQKKKQKQQRNTNLEQHEMSQLIMYEKMIKDIKAGDIENAIVKKGFLPRDDQDQSIFAFLCSQTYKVMEKAGNGCRRLTTRKWNDEPIKINEMTGNITYANFTEKNK